MNRGSQGRKAVAAALPGAWLLLTGLVIALSQVPGLPYNVVELFGRWPLPLAAAGLALALMLAFAPAVMLAGWLLGAPPGRAWLAVPGLLVHGLVTYLALRLAVPLESLHDLVGTPVLGGLPELEMAGRFAALFCWFDWMAAGGALAWLALASRAGGAAGRRWLLLSLLLVPLCYWVVVEAAATDNLVELLNTGAGGGFGLFLSAWFLVLALSGSALSARAAGLLRSSGGVAGVLLLGAGIGFLMAGLAMEPQVHKYGRTFSALSFLLSEDRGHYVTGTGLLLRYLAAHFGLVVVMAVAQYPVWRVLARRGGPGRPVQAEAPRKTEPEPAETPGTTEPVIPDRLVWLAVATGYLIFVIYGSLVPLEFRPMPLEQAREAFGRISYRNLGIGSRADWVANILLFIPLVFLWSGVACWGRRPCVLRGLVVLAGAVGLAVATEFVQLFFPPRTVSVNDLVAETLGGIIGLVLWWWKGREFLAWAGRLRWVRTRRGLAEYLLIAYVGGVFLYGVLPLDLTISPVEIYHKWKSGRVNLVPFAFPLGSPVEWVYALVTDALLWTPVAFLLVGFRGFGRLQGWALTVTLAVLLEGMQFFVYSRVTDVTDVLMAALGGALGALLAPRAGWGEPATAETAGWRPCLAVAGAALGGWALLLAALFWYPYDFRLDPGYLKAHMGGLLRLPFRAYYYGTEFRAVTEVLHKVLFFVPLGGLLGWLWHCPGRTLPGLLGRITGTGLALGMPAVIELGQVALPGKLPDSTDLILEYAGLGAGYFLVTRFLRLGGRPARGGATVRIPGS